MLRHVMVLVCAVLVAALGASSSMAAPRAQQIRISIDDTFVDPFWTEQCGFDVTFFSYVADLQVTLIRNNAGLVVREVDRAGGGRVTFSSDDGAFSYPAAPVQLDYGSGAVVGSSVVISFPGLGGHVPGLLSSEAGLRRLEGVVVVGFDELGLPVNDFTNATAVFDVGHRHSLEDIRAALCGALSGG